MSEGWIGVDLDGTLAKYDGWRGETHIGDPIPVMVTRVKAWIAKGITVKIVTARVSTGSNDRASSTIDEIRAAIERWCKVHIGSKLEVTCCKDFGMLELWDDRAVQVMPNKGISISEYFEALARGGSGSE